jgi:hypothetical protein
MSLVDYSYIYAPEGKNKPFLKETTHKLFMFCWKDYNRNIENKTG